MQNAAVCVLKQPRPYVFQTKGFDVLELQGNITGLRKYYNQGERGLVGAAKPSPSGEGGICGANDGRGRRPPGATMQNVLGRAPKRRPYRCLCSNMRFETAPYGRVMSLTCHGITIHA